MINIYSRRSFLDKCILSGAVMGLASLSKVPLFVQKALAEGTIGQGLNKKKLLFIFFRGANDGMNSLVPVLDDSYSEQRPVLYQPREGQTSHTDNSTGDGFYDATSVGDYGNSSPKGYPLDHMFDATALKSLSNAVPREADGSDPTFNQVNIIPTGNGFAAVHPSCKFLAPVFNAGDLAIIHRVAFPKVLRSHFQDQPIYENALPGQPAAKEGIFYRLMEEGILADPNGMGKQAITGLSFQSSLPVSLKGAVYPMANVTDPSRFTALGLGTSAANEANARKILTNSLAVASQYRYAPKGENRVALEAQFANLSSTLRTFADIDFSDTGNAFFDDAVTDGDQAWYDASGPSISGNPAKPANKGYWLFPVDSDTNGGWRRPEGGLLSSTGPIDANKFVMPTDVTYMRQIKAAALVLGRTNALVAGTELGGFDTHRDQVNSTANPSSANPSQLGRHTGDHANLQRKIAWTFYALKKFFSNPAYSPSCTWNDVVVVAMTEFGRTSASNSTNGTDHAISSVMFVAGGAVKGKVYCCHDTVASTQYQGATSLWTKGNGGQNGVMFGNANSYLQRCVDFRSVFGEIFRKHMGASDGAGPNIGTQLGRIIPGYAAASSERDELLTGGASAIDGVPIVGEVGLL
jgi:uncharacterized protein (DUF1501 family)